MKRGKIDENEQRKVLQMYENVRRVIVEIASVPMIVFMLAGIGLGVVGIFKRKAYYNSHSQSFTMWKAIGFSFYIQLLFLVLSCATYGIIGIADIIAIPFGNPMEASALIEKIVVILLTPVLTFGWIKGYKKISEKINALAEKEKALKEANAEGIDPYYAGDMVDGKKMQMRMYMAGMGSVCLFFIKVMFCWFIFAMWVLSIVGIFSRKSGDI